MCELFLLVIYQGSYSYCFMALYITLLVVFFSGASDASNESSVPITSSVSADLLLLE